jgi:hypothetical protein
LGVEKKLTCDRRLDGRVSIPQLFEIHTLSPMISRLMWPLITAKTFGPKSAPAKFEQFPKEMALRPSQIRASAAESALMIPDAIHFEDKYAQLKMPVVIIASEDHRLIDIDKQSARLHSDVSQSTFHCVPENGYMIHQTATGDKPTFKNRNGFTCHHPSASIIRYTHAINGHERPDVP